MVAYCHEIFSGIQGEGILVGTRQIFLRFHGCNLNCIYCDTAASKAGQPEICEIETEAGKRSILPLPNPLTAEMIIAAILQLNRNIRHHSLAFTGGEPLLHYIELNKIAKVIEQSIPIYLETNGTLYEELGLLDFIPDHIAMDVKLPSLTGCKDVRIITEKFINKYQEISSTFVSGVNYPIQLKLIFGSGNLDEIKNTLIWLSDICDYPLILQPVTAGNLRLPSPTPDEVLMAHEIGLQFMSNVRVIPQTHIMIQQK
jgi:7-carboxy-7-deazaguanine synthase